MAMRCAVGMTYEQIWREYQQAQYPTVSEHEKLQIHKKWKSLGQGIWKGVVHT